MCIAFIVYAFFFLHDSVVRYTLSWTNSAGPSIVDTSRDVNNTWIGSWPEGKEIWPYLDTMIMMLFGGIPWQVRQRSCAAKLLCAPDNLLELKFA